jgi:VWFA-related protein
VLLLALIFHAQSFKTTVELVTVPVTVTSRSNNQPIEQLTAGDFRVHEDGVEQKITLLDRERRPVSLCVVLDSSNSMAGTKQALAAEVVQHVFDGLRPEDEVSLVVFSGFPEIALTWMPVSDLPRIDWTQWKAAGMTALLDAMRVGVGLIGEAKNPRLVTLVVSDGEETGSVTSFRELAKTRRQSETQVYAFHTDAWPRTVPFDPYGHDPRPSILPAVVGDSGGTTSTIRVQPQAFAAARAFLDELRSQYLLGYIPSKPADGTYRRVKVETNDRTLRVRHRAGYLAMPQ